MTEQKETVIDLVKGRLGFKTDAALTSLLGLNRSCTWEWRQRLKGKIPTRHWAALIDEAKRQKKKLSMDELRGK
jgi:hypothetical protein